MSSSVPSPESSEGLLGSGIPYLPGGRVSRSQLSPSLKDVIFIKRSELVFRKRVGRGSFGVVYKARFYDQDVAVKIFNVENSVSRANLMADSESRCLPSQRTERQKSRQAELLATLEREVRVWKSISFGPVAQFFGICLEPAAIITEYCANQSLFDFLETARSEQEYAKRLTWARRLNIAWDVACGMQYLHDREHKPVLHRDLKTPNLLLDEHLNCKICDFSISSFVESRVVSTVAAANNPYWLAPEILQGCQYTRASDVYPFGTILWELMTWMFPYESKGEHRNAMAVLFGCVFREERPEIPPNDGLMGGPCPIYDDYCDLMKKCWKTNPGDRPTYAEIVQTLERFVERVESMELEGVASAPVTAAPSVPLQPASKSCPPPNKSRLKRCPVLTGDVARQIEIHLPHLADDWAVIPPKQEPIMGDSPILEENPSPFALMRQDTVDTLAYQNLGAPPSDSSSLFRSQTESSTLTVLEEAIPEGLVAYASGRSLDSSMSQADDGLHQGSAESSVRSSTPSGHLGTEMWPMSSERCSTSDLDGEIGQKTKCNGWDRVRASLLPENEAVHPLWDVLAKHLAARTSLHTPDNLDEVTEKRKSEKGASRAVHHWEVLRSKMLESELSGYPRISGNWADVLELVCPRGPGMFVLDETQPVVVEEVSALCTAASLESDKSREFADRGLRLEERFRSLAASPGPPLPVSTRSAALDEKKTNDKPEPLDLATQAAKPPNRTWLVRSRRRSQ